MTFKIGDTVQAIVPNRVLVHKKIGKITSIKSVGGEEFAILDCPGGEDGIYLKDLKKVNTKLDKAKKEMLK